MKTKISHRFMTPFLCALTLLIGFSSLVWAEEADRQIAFWIFRDGDLLVDEGVGELVIGSEMQTLVTRPDWNQRNWSTNDAPEDGHYVDVVVSTLGLADIELRLRLSRNTLGPQNWSVWYSVDGVNFADSGCGGTAVTSFQNNTCIWAWEDAIGSQIGNQAELTLRFYGYNADRWSGQLHLDEIEVTADTVLADLAVGGTVSALSAAPGDYLTYDIHYANHGTQIATNVQITYEVPITLSIISPNTHTPITTQYIWYIDSVPAGSSGTVSLLTQVTPDLSEEVIIEPTVRISSDQQELTVNDNLNRVTAVCASPRPPAPDITTYLTPNQQLTLSWQSIGTQYQIYAGETPYFDTDSATKTVQVETSYTTPLTGENAYYLVQTVNSCGVGSSTTNQVGVFNFAITAGQ